MDLNQGIPSRSKYIAVKAQLTLIIFLLQIQQPSNLQQHNTLCPLSNT